ncbi:MAG: universal stress protein [Solirubrobacterales bacterium]|jgi:nucleotide-binding universal stress UspA family protein|nr:universal stress protein [Solirubrobacterales bacterium]
MKESELSATGAGLQPVARAVARDGTVADTIVSEAHMLHADCIVMGSRGMTGVKSVILGSVSHAVVQHADVPILVVPSPEVARRRAGHFADARIPEPASAT